MELAVKCCDSPNISVGLSADTEYFVSVKRLSSSQLYKQAITTDNTGAFTINKGGYPAGYFAFGYLNIEIFTDSSFETVQAITKDGVEYNCILIELVDIEEL